MVLKQDMEQCDMEMMDEPGLPSTIQSGPWVVHMVSLPMATPREHPHP